MQTKADISFDQLIKAVKTLPKSQLQQLKHEIENKTRENKVNVDLEALLLNGPTATQKQLNTIENNRKAINKWRTQS